MVELPEEVKNMSTSAEAKTAAPSRPTHGRSERPGGSSRPPQRYGGGDNRGGGGRRPAPRRGGKRMFGGGKVCQFCVNKVKYVDYKNVESYRRYVTSQGKIQPRRLSGVCARHQRMACRAIKRGRMLALLPFKVK